AYGITKDPETDEFLMVTQHAELGDLRNFCNNYSDAQDNKWWSETIIEIMYVNEDLLEKFKDEKTKMTHPKAVYTSRYLRYQKIGEYLDLWEFQEDTRENKNLLGPQPWVKKDLKGFDMIAVPQ
ncbi:17915_t:CDS:2, partial [Racocetra persica]